MRSDLQFSKSNFIKALRRSLSEGVGKNVQSDQRVLINRLGNITLEVGTKSVLFGIHNPLLHGLLVARAWNIVYAKRPNFKELVAVFLHDVGYYGKPNMDGAEGCQHPASSAMFVMCFFPSKTTYDLIFNHSRTFSNEHGNDVSILALPDKFSFILYPQWLYLFLANLTGELAEYKLEMGCTNMTDKEWHVETVGRALKWVLSECNEQEKSRVLKYIQSSRKIHGVLTT